MADNETTTDIIAWLRKPREGENAYLTLWRDEIADRLEAAHKRERGNFAALREALKAISGLCDRLIPTWDGAIGRIKDIAEAALAAPPRNCDVGTAEEQTRRFMEFCIKHDECMKQAGKCPVFKKLGACKLEWAQMHYEEGGAK